MTETDGKTPVKEAIDVLLYDDAQGIRKRKVIFELQRNVQDADYAEDFLEQDGLNVITQLLKSTSGSVQGGLLQVLRGLLVYVNAIEQISESPDVVDKIYHLLFPPADGSPINLSVAKPTLEILIVICGMLEDGHKLVNNAAKHRVGVNMQPYSPLCNLISSSDLFTVRNTLLFMNILMKKKKAAADQKAKKLLFRWKECGLLSLLKPLVTVEDEEIQKQLTAFQKMSNFTIPRSWEEAHKYRTQFEEAKRRYDMVSDQLFIFQQQQAKMRLLKAELSRAQETVKAMSIVVPSASTAFHPTKRFADGGGLPVGSLLSTAIEPIDSSDASRTISETRKKIFESFVSAPDFKVEVEKVMGPRRRGRKGAYDPFGDSDDDFGPPDDVGPPSDDDSLPPPPTDEDTDDEPPPDEDLPPEDDLPPADDEIPTDTSGGTVSATGATAPNVPPTGALTPALGEVIVEGNTSAVVAAAGDGSPAEVAATPTDPAVAGSAPPLPPPVPTGPVGGGPPPPPPPGGRFTGGGPPPPPPPGGKFPGGPPPPPGPGRPGRGAAPADVRQFFSGPKPSKKMKVLHWEKVPLPDKDSLWNRLHDGNEYDMNFDYEEFEAMFSQKEVVAKEAAPPKPKKVLLLDEKVNQNLSIMLHKLPSIPNIQRALLDLDDSVITHEALLAIAGKAGEIDELKKSFLAKADTKPEAEYENTEKFVAMAISLTEFRKRVNSWLFTLEWEDNATAIQGPIERVNEAILSILNSKYFPYYMGILLGFGNMMNHGNNLKGNAPAVNITILTKLDASKDNRGKTSLMQHLVEVVRTRNPDALDLHEEMKPLFTNIASLRWEDIEKSVADAEREVQIFHNQSNSVKKALTAQGGDPDDPFIPKMAEYHVKAVAQLKVIQEKLDECRSNFERLVVYLGTPKNKSMAPQEIFAALRPFLEKVKKVAVDAAKEKKRQSKKGQTIGDANLSNVVGKLQEEMVQS